MDELIIDQSEELQTFQKFQLVWAKILGWPWWPARITQIPAEKHGVYKVQFFCDTSHAFLPSDKLINYAEGRDRHSTPKSNCRNFAKALSTADKLLQSNINPKDDVQSQTSYRQKLVVQQNQIINYSQQVKNAKKIENQNKQSRYQASSQDLVPKKITRKLNKPIRRLQKSRMVMKKQRVEQLQNQVKQLLQKYKLDSIMQKKPRKIFKYGGRKAKLVTKNFTEFLTKKQVEAKLARMIFKALSKKEIKLEQRYKISVTLMSSLFKNVQNGVKGNHRALFQWIRCSESQIIIQNYKQWPYEDKNEDTGCRTSS